MKINGIEITDEEKRMLDYIYEVLGISFNGTTRRALEEFLKDGYEEANEFADLLVEEFN